MGDTGISEGLGSKGVTWGDSHGEMQSETKIVIIGIIPHLLSLSASVLTHRDHCPWIYINVFFMFICLYEEKQIETAWILMNDPICGPVRTLNVFMWRGDCRWAKYKCAHASMQESRQLSLLCKLWLQRWGMPVGLAQSASSFCSWSSSLVLLTSFFLLRKDDEL